MSTKYETVIGLEVHLQFRTKTKMFSPAENAFGGEPNSRTTPVCLGLPGSLPVVNKTALSYAIKVGLALNCEINRFVKFDRKNYFYPDCPKGYQISQYDYPICHTGNISIVDEAGNEKNIRINRAHLEEDAGKLVHDDANNCSLVDYNRCGTPLLEIVTEADLRSPQEAYNYLTNLKLILSYLDVSDCDMEKGSLRCDANVSIRPIGQKEFGTKTELKNMNSFRAVKAGLEYEVQRQTELVESGESVTQETRLWDEQKQATSPMRSKEEAHDYRYFPEPDLVPFTLKEDEIDEVRKTLPELPFEKLNRFITELNLSEYDARILINDPAIARFFEDCLAQYNESKKISNWLNGQILQELNNRNVSFADLNLTPEKLIELITKVDDNTVSHLAAKDVLTAMIDSQKTAAQIIDEKGLAQVSDEGELEKIAEALINEHPDIAQQIREGKEKAVGFLVGQAMKKTKGKGNPKVIGDIIKRRLIDA